MCIFYKISLIRVTGNKKTAPKFGKRHFRLGSVLKRSVDAVDIVGELFPKFIKPFVIKELQHFFKQDKFFSKVIFELKVGLSHSDSSRK